MGLLCPFWIGRFPNYSLGLLGLGEVRIKRYLLIFVALILVACNLPQNQQGNPLQTAIAETLAAATDIAILDDGNGQLNPTESFVNNLPSEASGKIVYVCQFSKRSGVNQICIMEADGSDQRILTPPSNADNFFPSISKDGNSVLFSSDRSGRYQIYRLDLQSESLERLTDFQDFHAYAPAESPDREMIAFYARKTGEEYPQSHNIWLMGIDGVDPYPLTSLSGGAWDPAWSPDSKKILFASEINDAPQLFIIDMESLDIQQVTDLAGIRGRNDWSPNGFLLSTYVGVPWDRNIFTFDLQGGNLQQLSFGANNLAPSFSPDGQWIVFMSYRDHPREDLGCEIYIMRVDGSQPQRLTDNDICDWQPRWGP